MSEISIEACRKGGSLGIDNKQIDPDPPQITKTTAQRDCHIAVPYERLDEFSIPLRPDLFFKIYREDKLIINNEDAILKGVDRIGMTSSLKGRSEQMVAGGEGINRACLLALDRLYNPKQEPNREWKENCH